MTTAPTRQPSEAARMLVDLVPALLDALQRACRRLSKEPLTTLQWSILRRLATGDTSNQELAWWTGASPSAASRAVSALVAYGWVSRVDRPVDRRVVQLGLTDGGRAALAELARAFEPILSRISEPERVALVEGLVGLRRSLEILEDRGSS